MRIQLFLNRFFCLQHFAPFLRLPDRKGGMDMLRHLRRKDREQVTRQHELMRRYYRELLDRR